MVHLVNIFETTPFSNRLVGNMSAHIIANSGFQYSNSQSHASEIFENSGLKFNPWKSHTQGGSLRDPYWNSV